MNTPGRQVATREPAPPVKVDLSKPLTDLDQALRLADALALSDLVPRSMAGKSASILHVILTGQALNLHWTEALRVIYSPGPGQIGMRGQFLLSQLRKAGHTYKIEEGEESCTFTLTRGDGEHEVFSSTFTIDDAIQAGLAKRAESGRLVALSRDNKPLPWMQYTKRMLRWRAVSDCVSFGAPEVSLGMEIEGDLPEPEPEVQLKPSAPAPPPAAEAATSEAAGQADQLRELDERMRLTPQDAAAMEPVIQARPEYPDMGGNSANAVDPDMVEDLEAETEPGPTAPDAEAPTAPSASASPDEPVDAASKAKTVVLSEWFTKCGYDPKQYRAQVLHACSVYVQRRITGVVGLSATEVMHLTNELSGIFRRTDELAPVSRLADEVDKWQNAWRHADPEGFAAYEEGA